MDFISNSERELLVTRIGFEPNINRLRIYYPKPLDERAILKIFFFLNLIIYYIIIFKKVQINGVVKGT